MDKRYQLILIFLFGTLLRAGYLITLGINSDQAIFALQGIHILKGEFTVFQWAYAYMGTIQSYLDAFAFYFFDPSRLVINVIPVIISVFFILVTYLIGKELLGKEGGVLSAMFAAIAPAYLSIYGGVVRYGYMETLLFGSLLLLITLRLSKNEDPEKRGRLLILLGFIAGLGLWTNILIIVYFPACGLYLLFKDRRLFKKETFLTVPSFLLGSLPVWIYNLKHSFASLGILEAGKNEPFMNNLKGVILIGIPEILGVKNLEGTMIYGFSYILFAIFSFSIILLIVSGIKDLIGRHSPLASRHFNGTGLIVLFFLSFFIIFSASGFGSGIWGTRRYLLPLYSGIPILISTFLLKIRDRSKPIMGGVAVFVVFINIYGNLKNYGFLSEEKFKNYKNERRAERDLFDFMKSKGIFHAYVLDYWLGPLLTFDSKEEIIFAEPVDDRYPTYTERIDRTSKYAYLIGTEMEEGFEESLKRLKADYEKDLFGRYVLFYSVMPPSMGFQIIPTDGWSATSSRDISYIKNAYDRDIATRAATLVHRCPGCIMRSIWVMHT